MHFVCILFRRFDMSALRLTVNVDMVLLRKPKRIFDNPTGLDPGTISFKPLIQAKASFFPKLNREL